MKSQDLLLAMPAHGQSHLATSTVSVLARNETQGEAAHLYSFLLVDDHPLFLEGFSRAVKQLYPTAHLDIGLNASEARRLLLKNSYDLVFLDLNLPDVYGFHLLQELQQHRLCQPIVILSGLVDVAIVEKAKRWGAVGAISKRLDTARLATFCQRLLDGETVYEPELTLVADKSSHEKGKLTARELDVLQKLSEGLENSQICDDLGVSDSTLRTHLRALFQKMQVNNRTACVVKGIRLGWI